MASIGDRRWCTKIVNPRWVGKYIFSLNETQFPFLSSLSFDDYDLFSGEQLELIGDELVDAAYKNPLFIKVIALMIEMLSEAKLL